MQSISPKGVANHKIERGQNDWSGLWVEFQGTRLEATRPYSHLKPP